MINYPDHLAALSRRLAENLLAFSHYIQSSTDVESLRMQVCLTDLRCIEWMQNNGGVGLY